MSKSVLFNNLWKHHPYPDFPCDEDTFRNQCAIRMGVSLEKSGVDTSSFDTMFPNRRCYPGFKHNPKHILAAQQLADWILTKNEIFGNVVKKSDVTSKDYIAKKGVVFILNGWGNTDHIDVWNGALDKGVRSCSVHILFSTNFSPEIKGVVSLKFHRRFLQGNVIPDV